MVEAGDLSVLACNSPARPVLAPVETGEELLLVSPAREVRLEWKVGRFSLLPVEGVTLGGSTHRAFLRGHLGRDRVRDPHLGKKMLMFE